MTRIDCRDLCDKGPAGKNLNDAPAIKDAYDTLVKEGYVVLDNVVDPHRIERLNAEFTARYHNYFQNAELADTIKVGNMRYMIPVEFCGGFADPQIYANPAVVALARMALDINLVLESYGAVISLAGSQQQHIHRDGLPLFDSAISPMLPAHALTFVMPLIDMNEEHGTTALWPTSHRWKVRNESVPPIAPDVPAGSCLIWDFRLFHGGTPNRSTRHRPILYSTYARRWYQDPSNFEKTTQRRLIYDQQFLGSVPEACRDLFSHLPDRPWTS